MVSFKAGKFRENPISHFIMDVIDFHVGDDKYNKRNYLVVTKKLDLQELKGLVEKANAAWNAVCGWEKRIELEISLEEQTSVGDDIWPYIQVKCGESYYRISFPQASTGLSEKINKFGTFYKNKDITDSVLRWKSGEDVEFGVDEDKFTEEKMVSQETDLFVIDEKSCWSLDSGEKTYGEFKECAPSIFEYKLNNYKNQILVSPVENSNEVFVIEICKNENGLTNVVCATYCELNEIKTGWLKKLEALYRDGRSNLPDKVFDHIMEVRRMSEEELQTLCGDIPAGKEFHYNSYGVNSCKCDDNLSGKNYPAKRTILSQDKVRDESELEEIVSSWHGKAVVSWKLDGCAVRLYYKGRDFVRAVSKGKSRDVSELMKLVKGFKSRIYHGFPFVEDWFSDREWFVTGELVAVNERRSVAAGFLLRKDAESEETKELASSMRFIVYDSNICEYYPKNVNVAPIRLYSQMINLLSTECGFDTIELCEFRDAKQVASGCNDDLQFPYDIDVDGMVVRVNDIAKYSELGETLHHPKGSVAFKFEDEWKRTKSKCFYGKRGSNGVIKIIAEFEPVEFDGKVVRSAVWQPKNDDTYFELMYSSKLPPECREIFVGFPRKKFEEVFDVKEIEVCLRGKVIPQWRVIK